MTDRDNQFSHTRVASRASVRANTHIHELILLIAIGTASAATQSVPQEVPWSVGVDQIRRFDLLPAMRRTISIGAVTSYDRTGGNDDGFSGKYSFIRKEGDGLVIADLKGPGCITRIHTPTPTDDPLEFYFDGESTPRLRLPFRQLFTRPRRSCGHWSTSRRAAATATCQSSIKSRAKSSSGRRCSSSTT